MEVSNKDGGRSRMPADEAGDKEAERPWKCANWRTGLELVSFPSGCVGSAREKALTVSLELGLEVALALVGTGGGAAGAWVGVTTDKLTTSWNLTPDDEQRSSTGRHDPPTSRLGNKMEDGDVRKAFGKAFKESFTDIRIIYARCPWREAHPQVRRRTWRARRPRTPSSRVRHNDDGVWQPDIHPFHPPLWKLCSESM
ncbi:hypothetical protein E4U37_001659 [Claviceps purpurea]|nr:hypothetical protein E4U37_001659 [Claviceps purpurea]